MSETKKLRSVVTEFNDIKFDSKNPLAHTMDIDFESMTGEFMYEETKFVIRMPDKRKFKKFKKSSRKLARMIKDPTTSDEDKMDISDEVEAAQEALAEDMIIDFKFDDFRMDDKEALAVYSLMWEFYHFLSPRLEQLGKEYSSSIKG